MATLFTLPKAVPVSGGNSYAGAKAYFYQSGTTTPITTYTTAALSVAHANPVVADANGVFAPIFINEGVNATYKMRLVTASDTLIYEIDNLPATLNQQSLGAVLWPRTQAESDASVTPTNYYYEPGNVLRYGASTSAPDATNTTAVSNAILSAPAGGTVFITEHYTVNGNIQINGKSNLFITGGGRLTLGAGAATSAYIFQLVGTVSNLEIYGLELVGAALSGGTQAAIGCDSGQTISDVSFHDNLIRSINVGISLNANLSGSYTRAKVYGNTLRSIIGVASGQGYGIHIAKATHSAVYGNLIDGAQRHSIYQAAGQQANNVIANNVILNHRSGVATGGLVSALVVARSSHVLVSGNIISDFYDCGIEVAHVTSDAESCHNVTIVGNQIMRRRNSVAFITIGEQAVPGTYETTDVTIRTNDFYEDYALSGGGAGVNIFNGRRILFEDNRVRAIAGGSNITWFVIGNNAHVTDNADCEDTRCKRNTFDVTGTVGNFRAVNVCSDICGLTSRHRVEDNEFTAGIVEYLFDATLTNPNFRRSPLNSEFTGTLTGCATSPTATIEYTRDGDQVTLEIPALTATSNTTACTITGMNLEIRPVAAQTIRSIVISDNTADVYGNVVVETSGTLTLSVGAASGAFTASGTKGIRACSISYRLA